MTDRTAEYDDWRDQLVRREWGLDEGPAPQCRICGSPITFSQGRWHHGPLYEGVTTVAELSRRIAGAYPHKPELR